MKIRKTKPEPVIDHTPEPDVTFLPRPRFSPFRELAPLAR